MIRRQALRSISLLTNRPLAVYSSYLGRQTPRVASATRQVPAPQRLRCCYSTQSIVDGKIDEIQELYATARDEFEIAAEETEKMTVYAEDDRAAAREELTKLQTAYKEAIEGPDKDIGKEVQERVGQRIRELENAVQAMEEMAQNQD